MTDKDKSEIKSNVESNDIESNNVVYKRLLFKFSFFLLFLFFLAISLIGLAGGIDYLVSADTLSSKLGLYRLPYMQSTIESIARNVEGPIKALAGLAIFFGLIGVALSFGFLFLNNRKIFINFLLIILVASFIMGVYVIVYSTEYHKAISYINDYQNTRNNSLQSELMQSLLFYFQ